MKSFDNISAEQVKRIKYVLCDIDDTITTNGKLGAAAYSAMWNLNSCGIEVIPVTGRPAGWCDLIVREWPVKSVVGENGAFVFYMENGHRITYTHPNVLQDPEEKLKEIRDRVLREVPGSRVAKDQFARIYDLAIDFNEDPPYLGLEAAQKIKDICTSMGAEAKISSIHVNAWFGYYDKLSMTKRYFKEVLNEEDIKESVIFFGDSPNDEPMFEFFAENSCGVGNIRKFVSKMNYLPGYITDSECGEGFAEAVNHILEIKKTIR